MKTATLLAALVALSPMALAQHADHSKHGPQMQHGSPAHSMQMGHDGMQMGSSGITALRNLSGKAFDIAFLSQMIAHHQAALDMARQALKTAKHAETKREASKVVRDQTREIRQMTGSLQKWYGVKPSEEQMRLVRNDMKHMMDMRVATDRMFYEMMIPHHQGAIDMSLLVSTRSDRPEVKSIASNIIKAQRSEIALYSRLKGQVK